jgi:hypothetical protein
MCHWEVMRYEVGLCILQFTFCLKMSDFKGKLMFIKFCLTSGKTDTESYKKLEKSSLLVQVQK